MNEPDFSKTPSRINFYPRKDAYITEFNCNKNYGGFPDLFNNRFSGPGDSYRSLIQFDYACLGSNYIPPGSRIVSAHLHLNMFRNEISKTMLQNAYLVKQNWYEFTVKWNNQPLCSTASLGWIALNESYLGEVSMEVTDMARGWYDGSYVNHGLLLKGNEATNGLVAFFSRECPDSSNWPRLTIEYLSRN